jgi:hypothetical protein
VTGPDYAGMSHDNPVDTQAHEDSRAAKAERARIVAQQEADDIKWLMGSKRGRRILWRQLDRAGVFRSSFNTNAMQMAFNEGARNEGLRVLGLIHATSHDLYPTMVGENAQ